ncbi:hypothetical protein CTKA_00064 [Chthonomonas calidirosea]|uniref:Outer membrane protein beta-barrel domain-containing protein n=1 Tax=Chthonomonas calidirosea (strain DSM 23976 / ICMP 18418 / T49) TaxID=1303518 RepID=S0EYH6_CHTCT|nr:hypothetical protein [Chthonomonas calidirosea]CCW34917.1 hypothetical protein CCALI_01095 [Chthonomonas calidirosea T49]CEK13423.1 hypothetical protein CTKA_00064 [Chthonomonas calidirosea]
MHRSRLAMVLCFAVFVIGGLLEDTCPARAQNQAERTLASFFDIGGYFFLDHKLVNAIGSPKFYSEGNFFSAPARIGSYEVAGGVEFLSANDHFFPFSGGNSVSFVGPCVRFSTPLRNNHLRFLLTLGAYATTLNAGSVGVDTTTFAPGGAIEADYRFARYFTFSAGFRIGSSIHGYNTSGFIIGLRFF